MERRIGCRRPAIIVVMCGRFSQFSSVQDLVGTFAVDESLVEATEVRPRWNVAPSTRALVIAAPGDGTTRQLGLMRWGLVPRWAKDPSIGNKMINARAETIAVKNSYRSAFKHRRCIVPVDGFYEWRKQVDEQGRKAASVPFHIHTHDHTPLALAGLWEQWNAPDDEALHTFTIITCAPNTPMATVHDRMPVILDPADWDRWLATEPLDDDAQDALLRPAPDDLLVLDQVSGQVNSPRNDSPELVEPVTAT